MKKKSLQKREGRVAFSFIAPVIVSYGIFFWGPLAFILLLSFMKWDMFDAMQFIGLKNYSKLLSDPYFLKSLSISLIYTLSTTGLLLFFGVMLSILFDRPGLIPFLGRMFFFMSAILPLVSSGAIWTWIAGPESYSGLNSLMIILGLPTRQWLAGSSTALICVIGFMIWKNTGFNTLICWAGLRGIPSVYVDAAKIDGASRFRILTDITLPLLKPILIFLMITNMISGWGSFTAVWFLTKGGPGSATRVLPTYIYNYGFNRFQFGFASASAIMLIALILPFMYLRLRKL